jgi:DNA end-binding protein Ku
MAVAMDEAKRAAIGRFVLRQKEHLVALRVKDEQLVLQTLIYADEVVSTASLENADAADAEVSERELGVARQLVEMLSGPFEPSRYHDEYRDAVLGLIERKVAGEEIVIAPEVREQAAVPDLMAALQASIDAVAKGRSPGPVPAKPKRAQPTKGAPKSAPQSAQKVRQKS